MIHHIEPLVPGDAEEAETRATTVAWMLNGLDAVQTLPALHQSEAARWGKSDSTVQLTSSTWSLDPRSASDSAITDARAAGWLVTAGDTAASSASGRLQGLTVAVKDIIDVGGLPTRNGTPGGAWRKPSCSASAWRLLADAGARCVGKAAAHEMAWGVTTPQIPHPANPDRCTGGSSGGSAACVAAHISQAALGTDTGGSIRIPAALCGVVGFRPTSGSVSTAGVTPLAPEQDVVGPVAGDVRTCLAMLEVLLGRPCTPRDLVPASLRVGVLTRTGRLDPLVERAYTDVLAALQNAGVQLVPCDTPIARKAASISLLTMLLSSARIHAGAVHADPTAFGAEARALLTLGEQLADQSTTITSARHALRAHTAKLYADEELDAFITPTTPCTAPPRHDAVVDVGGRLEPVSAALTRFTAWSSVTAMPSISVPSPVPDGDMPVGVQVMAPPHHEHTCARIALIIERLCLGSST
jgi:Asp-tRNA(Asn)/Glu-tRNA(Gln) amidotransferase A subunit family amidase